MCKLFVFFNDISSKTRGNKCWFVGKKGQRWSACQPKHIDGVCSRIVMLAFTSTMGGDQVETNPKWIPL